MVCNTPGIQYSPFEWIWRSSALEGLWLCNPTLGIGENGEEITSNNAAADRDSPQHKLRRVLFAVCTVSRFIWDARCVILLTTTMSVSTPPPTIPGHRAERPMGTCLADLLSSLNSHTQIRSGVQKKNKNKPTKSF